MSKISQIEIIKEFFLANPFREISHPEVVDWAVNEWLLRTNSVFRDPDRAIRSLHSRGFLIKIKKGVYKYDPSFEKSNLLEDFTVAQKAEILKRDGYKCVICGIGIENGAELHVDHIKPKSLGGLAIIENGQTLCSTHNFRKKNLGQTETGKKMFIRLYELSIAEGDQDMIEFCSKILSVFDEHNVNGHIEWKQ